MSTIKCNKETNWKFLVKAINNKGEEISLLVDTHAEAQAIADNETFNQMKYFDEFVIIDGLNQHKDGLSFVEWLKKIYV
jgi:hypothetical protein